MDQRAQVDWQDRLLKDITADGLCIIGSDGRVQEVNQAYCQLLGYAKDELLGMTLAELDAADNPAQLKHHIDQTIANGESRFVTCQRTKDGQPVDLQVTLRYVDIGPEPYLFASLRDLRDHKRVEKAHSENEERFRRAFDHAPIGMALVDVNERFMQVNGALCEILGYTEEQLLSTTVPAITHPDDRQAEAGHKTRVRSGEIEHFEMAKRYIHADGHVVWGRLSVSPVTNGGGKPLYYIGQLEDITERKQAEEDLRIKDRAIASAINAIAMANLEGDLTYVNRAFLDLWGYDNSAEVLGRSVVDFWQSPEQASEVVKALHNQGSWRGELIAKKKDGSFVDVELSASMVLDADKRPHCLMASFIDVAGRKRTEQALRSSEERYRHLVETVPHGIQENDLNGIITFTNQANCAIYGYDEGTLVGKAIWDLAADDTERERTRDYFYQLIKNQPEPSPFVSRDITKDGRLIDVQVDWNYKRDEQGRAIGFISVITDITERVTAARSLQKERESLQAVLDTAVDGIIAINEHGIIESYNPAAERIFGYSREEVTGQNVAMLMPEPDRSQHQKYVENYLRTGKAKIIGKGRETIGQRKDGSKFPLELAISEVRSGERCVFTGIVRDITERKRAEAELRESQRVLNTLMSNLPGMAYRCRHDEDWTMEFVSEGCLALIGYSPDELLLNDKISFGQCIHPDDRDAVSNGIEIAIQEKKSFELVYRLVTARRETKWVWEQGRGIFAPDGELVALEGFISDITERKQAEEKIKASEQELSAILDSMQDTYYRTDREGRLTRLSRSIQELAGYTPDEIVGTLLADHYVDPEDREVFLKKLRAQGGVVQNHETLLKAKDGSHICVSTNAHCYYDQHGNVAGVEGTTRNITQLKHADDLQRRFGRILDNSFNEIYIFDAETLRFTQVNRGGLSNLGYSLDEVQQLTPPDLKPDFTDEAFRELVRPLREGSEEKVVFGTRHRRKDGSDYPVEVNLQLARDETRSVFVAIIQDISERQQAQEALRESEAQVRLSEAQMVKLSRALEQTADSVIVMDRDGLIEYVNAAFEKITGFSKEEVIGRKGSVTGSGHRAQDSDNALWQKLLAGEVVSDVLINRRKDGSLYYEENTITPIKDNGGNITHFISSGKDITERMQTEERLQYLVHHDALTELPNRALFMDRLGQTLARAQWHDRAVAVLFLDLDRFKMINDTLGHEAGDRSLQRLSKRLSACVHEGDTVARVGGDEFAIVIDNIALADSVAIVARKILEALSRPFVIDGHEFYVTTSIGISLYPEDGADAQTLLKHADIAMYRSKEQGRNTYQFYSAHMSTKAFERLNLETSLRHALEREEFRLHYQPQVDLESGRVTGVEALLRWQHPDLGLVAPVDFIPLLEETGLILPVGEWVLWTACTQIRSWQEAGLEPVRMAINLSGRQFDEPHLVDRITEIMREAGLDPIWLEFEITESVLMKNESLTMEAFQALEAAGVRLAIDDFGTGYSSLSYLKRFPIDTIKIDRSFIRDVTVDPDDAAIAQAIIAMGRSLKLHVIAEGVETQEQLAFLREQQCHGMQGYLFSRPVPAEEITPLLKKTLSEIDQNE